MITQHVKDELAQIEAHRQQMAKEGGVAMACNEALRKLHDLVGRERNALHAHGPASEHAQNVEAVSAEIERVKTLAGAPAKGVAPKQGRPQAQKHVGPGAAHSFPRNKGRRTMGRTSGR